MSERTDILISLSQPYVDHVLSGRKTVELRRRAVNVSPGTRVWIYAKAPQANFPAVGVVREIVTAAPAQLWKQFRKDSAVTLADFQEYFVGVSTGCAIVFESVQMLEPTVALNEIRRRARCFHPPQFFKRLSKDSPELKVLLTRMPGRDVKGCPQA
ncbi:MAG TPA: ASCH domain-containing protein [Terriglobales bacterium]|jgi:predicted transcriptional regulator|nr:ASCH domain-containing protein [Terriglobales bacterium]